MTDYIDRQAAIAETWQEPRYTDPLNVLTEIRDRLYALPPIDAVEIVRCRDCKHNPNDTWFECPISHLPYEEDRWCWKGERKDE